MSSDTLERDFQSINDTVKMMDGLTTPSDIVNYLKYNLVPFVGATTRELVEHSRDISDIIDNAQDILHEESAGLFAAVIQGARTLVQELEKRLAPGPGDDATRTAIKEWTDLAAQGEELLEEITIPDPEDDAEPENKEAST